MAYPHGKAARIGRALMGGVFAAALAAGAPASAQDQTPGAEPITLSANHSTIARLPWPAVKVTVTDPKIADVQVINPQQILIIGKAPGATSVLVTGNNEQVWSQTVDVEVDPGPLKAELAKLFPHSAMEVGQAHGTLIISGKLSGAREAQQLHTLMDASGLKYADLTVLPGVPQVQLKVTIAEASRSAVRALGMNVLTGGKSAFGGINIGPESGGPINPMGVVTSESSAGSSFAASAAVSPATTLFGGVPSADLEVFVQALEENQYLRVLAEPTLVALSGQEASFLAGGEFPIPVPQNNGGSTTITVEYKEFGVRLKFRPMIEGDGEIRLHVAPEVSELSNGPGSVQISGFNIPALLTRRAETELKLHNGQTFAMAGLISQSVDARNSRVPGLGDVPILGPLFRSVRYQRGDTELLVLVTASLAEPSSDQGPVPGDAHVQPDDWQLYAEGLIEGSRAVGEVPADLKTGLGQLKGPGAWASFDSPTASSEKKTPETK